MSTFLKIHKTKKCYLFVLAIFIDEVIRTLSNIYNGIYRKNTLSIVLYSTAQEMKFSIKDFFSTCDQIRRTLWIWSYLLKKALTENFIFCAVRITLLTVQVINSLR